MAGNYPITRTKIIVPRRREDILTRQRLLTLLNDLLDLKLIIIAAPAGYGKTSLLIDFANHTQWPISWLSLDALDQDFSRFLTHFVASIQERFPDFGRNSFSLLNNTPQNQLDTAGVVSTLVNDIYEHIPEHFLIVLDDYQLVEESDAINAFINQFLQDADENCHLVVSSRRLLSLVDMPLWVARNLVGGISYQEISFTTHEVQNLFLQNYHLSISDREATQITEKSEGWITGLLLSTHLLQDEIGERLRLARVSGVDLYDYMAQQVFDHLPLEIREFLLRSSLLEEFNLERCERVIGKALDLNLNWQCLMDRVMSRNLFLVPVAEGSTYWLRFHHLFRDFLQTRMRQERPEEARKIIVALAGDYAERKDWERAFVLYRTVNAVEAMISLVEKAGPDMVTNGQLVTLKAWISDLPPAVATSNPAILSLKAAILIGMGEVDQGILILDEVIERLNAQEAASEALSLSLVRRAYAFQTLGKFQESQMDSQRAIEIIQDYPEFGLIRAEAMRILGGTYYLQGNINQALMTLKQSLRLFESFNDEQNIPKLLFNIGFIQAALGNYPHAEKLYLDALDRWQSAGNFFWAAEALNNLGVLQQQRGDFDSAARQFEKAIQYARISNSPHAEAASLCSLGDLYRDLDAFQEAIDIYNQSKPIAKQINNHFLLFYLDLAEGVLSRRKRNYNNTRLMFDTAQEKAGDSASEYMTRLLDSEWSMYDLMQNDLQSAYEAANTAFEFFKEGGNENESLKAEFVLALANAGMGETHEALGHLDNVISAILKDNYSNHLIIQARESTELLSAKKYKPVLRRRLNQILQKAEHFEEQLAGIRRKIRRQATMMPFAPPKMIIRSFGKSQVFLNKQVISSSDWQTQTARNMFFYILAHPDGLSKEQIGLVFWPDSTQEELKLRFKNTLYRLRRAVGREAVILENDYYRFNWSLDYEYDVENFIASIKKAKEVEGIPEKIALYENAVDVYKGDYLSEIEIIQLLPERQRYILMYLDALLKLSRLYMTQKEYKPALRYCYQALGEDACLEDAHRLAMRIHAAAGNRAAVVRQYEQCCAALSDEINVPPSQQTRELYETLIQS